MTARGTIELELYPGDAPLGRLAERYDPELIVIACNTASTIALDAVRSALDLPVVGTVPAIKPAAALSKSRVIGVLGTPATVVQPYVDRLARGLAVICDVIDPDGRAVPYHIDGRLDARTLRLGYRFGAKGAFDLSYRYQHLSNGGIKHPNNGVNFNQIRLQYHF